MKKNSSSPRVQKLSPLIGRSPYFPATERAGCRQYTIYNHMYFPHDYGHDPVEVYDALTKRATLADVGAERQVAISGADAMNFANYLVTKDISGLAIGACAHSVCCDETGKVITDPVILRIAGDTVWLSGSDADLILWAKGVAYGMSFDVTVTQPDCGPLQLQGPLSGDILEQVVGQSFRTLKRFECMTTKIHDVDIVLARLGWSRELGYEVFPMTSENGLGLWDAIAEAGEPHGLMVAPPSYANAVESGITTCCYGSSNTSAPRFSVPRSKRSLLVRNSDISASAENMPRVS